MESLRSEFVYRINSQSEEDHVPADTLHTYCTDCMKSIKDWLPVDYKNEIIQLFKIAGPVVSIILNTNMKMCPLKKHTINLF